MKEISDIRRENLQFLIDRSGSIAGLNEALGRKRNDSTLSQILHRVKDSKTGTPKAMGSRLARGIETSLNLGYGWMDSDHSSSLPEHTDGLIHLKHLSISACCGERGIANYEEETYIDNMAVSREWFHQNINRMREQGYELITAQGDSMEPTLKNGDLVVIDRRDTDITRRDGIFAVVIDGDLYIKRVQKVPGLLKFISDNKLYDSFEIRLAEVENRVYVCGRVVNSMNLRKYD